jgi:putative DNA primase/helicase
VLRQRASLVTAALTILRAYVQAGCPPQTTQAYGSFDEWYQKIAGALMWLGEPDPCEGRKALQAEVEDELLTFRQLVLCWHACYHATLSTARTLKQVTFEIRRHADPQSPNQWDDLREALVAFDSTYDGSYLDTRPAAYALRKYQGRVIDGKRFMKGSHTMHGTPWVLTIV